MAHVREVQRKAGTGYEVRWRDGDRFVQKTFPVKRDAERWALKVENTRAEGQSTDLLVRNSKTVRDVVEASLAASRPELKERTYIGYRRIYDNRVLPRFGSRKVGTVTRADVQAWLVDMTAEGLAPATVQHHYVALQKAMRFAQHDRLIGHNPCDGVKLPKNHRADGFAPVFLTGREVETLAAHLDDAWPYGLLVRFAAWSGLRAAELTGLRMRDVDLERREVHVRCTLQRIGGEWVAGTPKSARSTRDVPIARPLLAALREYKLQHPTSGDEDALFWPGRTVGSHAVDWSRVFDVASFRRNYLRPALRRLGMAEMRFHDLRHTYASLMLTTFEAREVSHWMGHANTSTTDMIYGHLYPHDHDRFDARFDVLLAQQAER